MKAKATGIVARPKREWHEDHGFVTWWKFPVCEPSYIGSPLCSDWPGYHTHWTPHPEIPEKQHFAAQARLRKKADAKRAIAVPDIG